MTAPARAWLALAAGALLAAAAPVTLHRPAPAAAVAPAQVGDGQRVLQASRTEGLDPNGERITVSGRGFDVHKGIYVAFCVIPPPGQVPGPCGGGEDRAGATGASAWISSNPPPYGVGVATPYGPGGSFTVELAISPVINASTDCRRVRCAVATRNDHLRSSDRSQDLLLPVTFRSAPDDPPPAGGPPPAGNAPGPVNPVDPAGRPTPADPADPTPPPADTSTTTSSTPPPVLTLSPDGLVASAGPMQLRLSHNVLDPDGDRVTVRGTGFAPDRPVEVALCALAVVGEPPETCTAGVVAEPAGDGGFELDLEVRGPTVGERDCRETACAIVSRNPVDPAERSQELAVPVRFGTAPSAVTVGADDAAPSEPMALVGASEDTPTGRSGTWPVLAAIVLVVVGVLTAVALLVRHRRPGAAGPAAAGLDR